MPTTIQIQAWLDEAIAARHALLVGKAAVSIRTPEGRSVEYTKTTLNDLNIYIASLEAMLNPNATKRRASTFRVSQTGNGY